jgi:hypothetical protein
MRSTDARKALFASWVDLLGSREAFHAFFDEYLHPALVNAQYGGSEGHEFTYYERMYDTVSNTLLRRTRTVKELMRKSTRGSHGRGYQDDTGLIPPLLLLALCSAEFGYDVAGFVEWIEPKNVDDFLAIAQRIKAIPLRADDWSLLQHFPKEVTLCTSEKELLRIIDLAKTVRGGASWETVQNYIDADIDLELAQALGDA